MTVAHPVISVCIVTSRRHGELTACLQSVVAQRSAPPFEVLVCANGDDDATAIVESLVPRATVIEIPPTSLGSARNHLAERARGELLLFLDDDVVVDQRLFARLARRARQHPTVAVFGGPNLTPPGSSVFQIAQGAVLGSAVGAGPVRRRYGRHPAGAADERFFTLCNLTIRRSAMTSFPPDVTGGEETALLLELERRSGPMHYDPHLHVFHERRPGLASFAVQMFKYGSGRGQVIIRDRSAMRPAYLAPVALIAYLLALVALLPFGPLTEAYVPLALYVTAVVATALHIAWPLRDPRAAVIAAVLIPVVHLAYGAGIQRGIWLRGARRARVEPTVIAAPVPVRR